MRCLVWASCVLALLGACNYDVDTVDPPCSYEQPCTSPALPYCGDELRCVAAPACAPEVKSVGTSSATSPSSSGIGVMIPASSTALLFSVANMAVPLTSVADASNNTWNRLAASQGSTMSVEIWAAFSTQAASTMSVTYGGTTGHSLLVLSVTCVEGSSPISITNAVTSGATVTLGSLDTEKSGYVFALLGFIAPSANNRPLPTNMGFTEFRINLTSDQMGSVIWALVPPGTYAPAWQFMAGAPTASAGAMASLDHL